MLITKTNPVGIDWYIQNLQSKLYNSLISVWPEGIVYNAYGRCYRNKTDDGYIAEVFQSNKDYKEVYWDDSLSAISFFGMSNNIKAEVLSKADVHLVFFVDLKKLKPTFTTRADEELRQDISKIIGQGLFGFTYNSTEFWLENVLREYPGSTRDQRLKYVDMHPVHCFRINMTLSYNQNKNCSSTTLKY